MAACISVFIILVLLRYSSTSEAKFTVLLEVISNPVVFGETVRLQCKVTGIQQCYGNYVRTWTHGTDDKLIFNNGRLNQNIANETKYVENVENPCQLFSLLITNFSEKDADDTYGCSFTVDTQIKRDRKRIFSLNGTQFEYIPTSDLIETELKWTAGRFGVTVKIKKVHPMPECTASYKGNPLHLNVSQYNVGIFYNVCMTVNGIMDNNFCAGLIQIVCKIGNQTMNVGTVMNTACGNLIIDVERKKINVEIWWIWIAMVLCQILPKVMHKDTYRCIASSLGKRLTRYIATLSVFVALAASALVAEWRNHQNLTEFRRYITQYDWRILTCKICVLLIMGVLFYRRFQIKQKIPGLGLVLIDIGKTLMRNVFVVKVVEIYGLYLYFTGNIFSCYIDELIWFITLEYFWPLHRSLEETKKVLKDRKGSFEIESDESDNEVFNPEIKPLSLARFGDSSSK